MDDIFEVIPDKERLSFYYRDCQPTESGMLMLPNDVGYIQLHPRQKWKLKYCPQQDTCFMTYHQFHVKLYTREFLKVFAIPYDACGAVEREMKKVMARSTAWQIIK